MMVSDARPIDTNELIQMDELGGKRDWVRGRGIVCVLWGLALRGFGNWTRGDRRERVCVLVRLRRDRRRRRAVKPTWDVQYAAELGVLGGV